MDELLQVNFYDRPDRFKIRWIIEDILGGYMASYNGSGFTLAMPKGESKYLIIKLLEHLGYEAADVCWFPLGTDKPPEHLRHQFHKYGFDDPPGSFWLYYKFEPRKEGENGS